MAFIPSDAIWYIAQVVLEITVEGEIQNVIHINYLLVRADSPAEAYEKAVRLGTEHETKYLNEDKKEVRILFRGLRNLTVVYEGLEHGSELLFEERVGLSREELEGLTRPKKSLAVFAAIEPSPGPRYGAERIREEAKKLSQSDHSAK